MAYLTQLPERPAGNVIGSRLWLQSLLHHSALGIRGAWLDIRRHIELMAESATRADRLSESTTNRPGFPEPSRSQSETWEAMMDNLHGVAVLIENARTCPRDQASAAPIGARLPRFDIIIS